jgi:hypothetical protein
VPVLELEIIAGEMTVISFVGQQHTCWRHAGLHRNVRQYRILPLTLPLLSAIITSNVGICLYVCCTCTKPQPSRPWHDSSIANIRSLLYPSLTVRPNIAKRASRGKNKIT